MRLHPFNLKQKIFTAGAVLSCTLSGLFLRTYFVYDQVFTASHVNFQEADPWYHVRAVEHLTHNFPHRIGHDPYALHPGGQQVAVGPLLDLMIAATALLLGFGRPSMELTHAVCAWFPAVMGAMITIPAYFLGKRLRDRKCGLIAACLSAILPGPLLQRSLLGFTDHHVAECFFGLTAVWVFVEALGKSAGRAATLLGANSAWQRRQGPQAILAGVVLGLYLLTWVGGALLVMVLCAAGACVIISDHRRGLSIRPAALCSAISFATAAAVVLPYYSEPLYNYHLAALIVAGGYLATVAIAGGRRGRWGVPVAMLASAAVGLVGLRVFAPSIFRTAVHEMRRFLGGSAGTFVTEAGPLLYEEGEFTWAPAYEMFTTGLITGALGLLLVGVRAVRRGEAGHLICAVVSAAVLIGTLRQQRFAYYLAICLALLSAYFWSIALDFARCRFRTGYVAEEASERPRPPLRDSDTARPTAAHGKMSSVRAAAVVVYGAWMAAFAGLAVYPCVSIAVVAAGGHIGPHADWREAMQWLRTSTPEPFGDSEVYFADYEQVRAAESTSPAGGYGVMCWWDHGYWITQMARRVPCANPTQAGAGDSAAFFAAQSEDEGAEIMRRLEVKYVVVEATLPVWEVADTGELTGKLGTMIRWTGRSPAEFYEPYLLPLEDGRFKPILLYYPAYYQSMLSRLYLYGGKAFAGEDRAWAVRYSDVPHRSGPPIKRIEQTIQFRTFEAAREFVGRNPGKWKIAGVSPAESCVPLEALSRFRPVYQSLTEVADGPHGPIAYVEIFEFLHAESN